MKYAIPSLFILVLMISIGPFGDTLYAPSLPEIAKYFDVPYANVQLTMTTYLIGYAIGQLLYGPLSDKYGRRPIMLLGAFVFILGSTICWYSPTNEMLIFGRLIQGLGSCAGAVISTSAVKDAFPVAKQSSVFAKMNIAFAIAPGLGPVVGSFIAQYFAWHVNFLLLLLLSTFLFICVWFFLPETIKEKNSKAMNLKHLIKNYLILFTIYDFVLYTIILGISISMVYTSLVVAPALFVNLLHLSKMFFLVVSAGIVISFVIGSTLCAYLCNKITKDYILVIGMLICLSGALILLSFMSLSIINVWSILLPLCLIFIGIAFIIPIATALALAPFKKITGSASAMLGCIQMGFAGLVTALVTFIDLGIVFTIPVYFTTLSLVGLMLLMIKISVKKS